MGSVSLVRHSADWHSLNLGVERADIRAETPILGAKAVPAPSVLDLRVEVGPEEFDLGAENAQRVAASEAGGRLCLPSQLVSTVLHPSDGVIVDRGVPGVRPCHDRIGGAGSQEDEDDSHINHDGDSRQKRKGRS